MFVRELLCPRLDAKAPNVRKQFYNQDICRRSHSASLPLPVGWLCMPRLIYMLHITAGFPVWVPLRLRTLTAILR
jgi:hypothetical protein